MASSVDHSECFRFYFHIFHGFFHRPLWLLQILIPSLLLSIASSIELSQTPLCLSNSTQKRELQQKRGKLLSNSADCVFLIPQQKRGWPGLGIQQIQTPAEAWIPSCLSDSVASFGFHWSNLQQKRGWPRLPRLCLCRSLSLWIGSNS